MLLKKIKIILDMIKFEHTIFALPFAYMGAILGNITQNNYLPSLIKIFWITLAMVGARSAAMSLNRLIDRYIDEKNPRTFNRAIPAKKIDIFEVIIFIVISFILLIFAAYKLNMLAVKLLPIAVLLLVIYSYTKRFTWLCHIVLGLAIGLAPLGGWIAVTGNVTISAIILFLTVTFWTAGFDVIYATQDIEFDRKEGLFSIPVKFGLKYSLYLAKVFHTITIIGLLLLYYLITQLTLIYLIGVFVAIIILYYEHKIISPDDLSRLDTAFFTMNGILSVIVFSFTFLDLVI